MTRSDDVRAREFFDRCRYGVVSSLGDDGAPQAAVVGLALGDDGSIVFDTLGTSRKAKNLRRDGRCAVVIWDGERTLQIEGVAVEPTGAARERALETYFRVFPDGRERLSWPHITHFAITPHWARDSDYDAVPEARILEVDLTGRAP